MKAHGGDVIEAKDGRIGRVVFSSFSLIGRETVYGIMHDGDMTRPDLHSEDDAKRRVPESEVSRIVSYGRHDYQPNAAYRGHCERCGIAKKEHS